MILIFATFLLRNILFLFARHVGQPGNMIPKEEDRAKGCRTGGMQDRRDVGQVR